MIRDFIKESVVTTYNTFQKKRFLNIDLLDYKWFIHDREIVKFSFDNDLSLTKEEIDFIVFRCSNSLNRFEYFLSLRRYLYGDVYWYALRNAYVSSDDLYRFSKLVKECFSSEHKGKENLMVPHEIETLNSLPEKVIIYRGMALAEKRSKNFGVSWTLKKEVADFFAHEYRRNFDTALLKKTVHSVKIEKTKIIAFFNGREESEVIIV